MAATQPRYVAQPLAPMIVEPVTLEGQYVRLEPIASAHHAGLCAAVLDPDLWRWFPFAARTSDDMHQFIDTALQQGAEGSTLAFTVFLKSENRIVGSSRFISFERDDHHVEIGATLIGKPWQRTPVNTETKYLMLRHAFETWGCLRVEFKADALNEQSRAALARLGAKQEGIFRNHILCEDGRVRDSIYFSITDDDWLDVKAHLETKLARPYIPHA